MNQETPNLVSGRGYGFVHWHELFTPRQLVALTTLSDLIGVARERVRQDVMSAVSPGNSPTSDERSRNAAAYADAIATYLALAVGKQANYSTTICTWHSGEKYLTITSTFARQALPMTWDFAEGNIFSRSSGNFYGQVASIAANLDNAPSYAPLAGKAIQADATVPNGDLKAVVSTDPPYYDNIIYSDLADFFYIWLRHSLSSVHSDILGTMLTPKTQELVAAPYRFKGGKTAAREFFETGLGKAFDRLRKDANPAYPVTVYYAFKQAESEGLEEDSATASTGWETMLEGLLRAGFQITGTWPVRTEYVGNLKKKANALASSIVLVCRLREESASPATRQEFVRALRRELPDALSVMMAENVAPVDLAQATIGPGMAIYSRYSKVVEADGSPMRVRTALQIINQSLDEHLAEAEGEVDSHTRFALTWFEQRGMESGPYGEAESIATARNVSVRGVQEAGVIEARAGKVHLLPREKLLKEWDPQTDSRPTDWEVVQYLIRALEMEGEQGAAMLLARIGERGEAARDLAYRLYGICERKKWAEEALAYNALVVAWPEITRLASQNPSGTEQQTTMDF